MQGQAEQLSKSRKKFHPTTYRLNLISVIQVKAFMKYPFFPVEIYF